MSGRPAIVPGVKTQSATTHLPLPVYDRLAACALSCEDASLSGLIRQFVIEGLERWANKQKTQARPSTSR